MKKNIKIGNRDYLLTSDDVYLEHMGPEFEPHMVKLFQSLIGPDDIVADIGANIGMTAILFSGLAKKVYAFEPSPSTFSILRKNLDSAGTKNVETQNLGLGNAQESLTITFAANNRSGRFVSDKIQLGTGHVTENIFIDTIDSWFTEDKPQPTFLKIDVEGFEQNVIKGGQQFITKNHPSAVMEMNHFCLDVLQRITIPDFLDFMRSVFPYLYAVDTDNSVVADLHVKDEAYMVMHEHVVRNRFPNIVGGFDQNLKSKLNQINQKQARTGTPIESDQAGCSTSSPLTAANGKVLISRNTVIQPGRNEKLSVSVTVCNESHEAWHTDGSHPVHLSYHWIDSSGNYETFDGIRSKLKCGSLLPGKNSDEVINIQAPENPGNYRLVLTLVQEGVFWFEDKGFACQILPITIK